MYGAILGDIAGSLAEFHPLSKNADPWSFQLAGPRNHVTDDSVMTLAVARALREADGHVDLLAEALINAMHDLGARYPRAGYGGRFRQWLRERSREPYNSFGNGSAMRVSPAGWAWSTLEETLEGAAATARVTHNHPHGVAGAQATAEAIFMARKGASAIRIKERIESRYGYNLSRSLKDIQPTYRFDVTCQGSVPEALICALGSSSVEEALRLAVWLGGDADTQAAIAGSVAEAMHGMPDELKQAALDHLDDFQKNEVRLWEEWLAKRLG